MIVLWDHWSSISIGWPIGAMYSRVWIPIKEDPKKWIGRLKAGFADQKLEALATLFATTAALPRVLNLNVPSNINLLQTDLRLTVIASQLITSYSELKPLVFVVHDFFNHCILNKCSWVIEVVDQLTVPVKLAVFRPSQNQEKCESALPQFSRGLNNATWVRKSEQANPPETSIYKQPTVWHVLIGPQNAMKGHSILPKTLGLEIQFSVISRTIIGGSLTLLQRSRYILWLQITGLFTFSYSSTDSCL